MSRYIVRRLIQIIPVLWIISVIIFCPAANDTR